MLKRRPFNKEVRPENKKQWSEFLLSLNLTLDDLLRAMNKGTLVFDSGTLSSAVQNYTISNLDGVTQGGYEVEFCIYRGANATISLYLNGNTTASNYRRDTVATTGGASASASDNTATLVVFSNAADWSRYVGDIIVDPIGDVSFVGMASSVTGAVRELRSTSIWAINGGTPLGNVTSITINSSVANGIGANSRFRIWRKV